MIGDEYKICNKSAYPPTLPEKKYHKVNVFLNDILPSQTLQIIRFLC